MGCEQGRDEEKPVHRVWVDAFEMAVLQVRNRDYALFLAATGATPPPQWNDSNLNHPDQPVVSVSWFEAVAYCEWLSGECRRENIACRPKPSGSARRAAGREGALYVWGDEATESQRTEYVRRWGGTVNGPRPVGEETPKSVRRFRYRRKRARMVRGLVRPELLCCVAGAQSAQARHRATGAPRAEGRGGIRSR